MDFDKIVVFGAYGVVGRAIVRNLIATGVDANCLILLGRDDCERELKTTARSLVINCSTATDAELRKINSFVDRNCTFVHISSTASELKTEYGEMCKKREDTILNVRESVEIIRMGVIIDENYPQNTNGIEFIGYWEFLNARNLKIVINLGAGLTFVNSLSFFPQSHSVRLPFIVMDLSKLMSKKFIPYFPFRRVNRLINLVGIGVIG